MRPAGGEPEFLPGGGFRVDLIDNREPLALAASE